MEGVLNGGVGKYFTGAIPSDASDTALSDTTYCQVVFSKKFYSLLKTDTIHYASGVISGYASLTFGKTSPNKYNQRWDFNITFENLAYNIP